jgi:tRNA threonylcarbamoyl adenosine modification protein YeaZ
MRVLAIDTATDTASAALAVNGAVVAERVLATGGAAARHVLGLVDEVLAEAGVTLADLGGIAVGTGPGSFTGIRIAMATAAALADGAALPLAGASTFRGLGHGAPSGAFGVIDARRREVFAAGDGLVGGSFDPASLAAILPSGSTLIGDGAVRYRELFTGAGHLVPDDPDVHHVRAGGIALAARFDGLPVEPTYLREPDAVPSVMP